MGEGISTKLSAIFIAAPAIAVKNDIPLCLVMTYTVPRKDVNAVNTIESDKTGTYFHAS